MVGPAPHDEVHRNHIFGGDPADNPRNTMRNLQYSKIVEKVAKELDVAFIDLWHLFLESVGWKEGEPIPGKLGDKSSKSIGHLLNDGLHFTGEGYRIWYDAVEKAIETKYPELIPTNLPFLFPEWNDATIEKFKQQT